MDESLIAELELTEVVPTVAAPVPRDWDTQMRTFRVRLIRFDRPQSKTLTLRANSESGARAQAQTKAGREWRIAGINAR